MSVIGCASGEVQITKGDEPSGLIPSLLVAGATSVLATLWPIRDQDGKNFSLDYLSQNAYGAGGEGMVDLARALRRAALNIRKNDATTAPYYWAPFVLHGAWKRTRNNVPSST